jgi:hypothetical protein
MSYISTCPCHFFLAKINLSVLILYFSLYMNGSSVTEYYMNRYIFVVCISIVVMLKENLNGGIGSNSSSTTVPKVNYSLDGVSMTCVYIFFNRTLFPE